MLIGIVLLVGGFFAGPPRGPLMIGAGIVIASLAGLELSAREHFAGYRSHTLLLAGTIGVGAMIALFAVDAPVSPTLRVAIGVALFGLAGWWFAISFRRRSGGAIFKFR